MDATFDNNFGTTKPKRQVAEDENDSWSDDGGPVNCFEEDKGDCDEEPRDWEDYMDEDDEDEASEVPSQRAKTSPKKKKNYDEYDDEDEDYEDDDEELEAK